MRDTNILPERIYKGFGLIGGKQVWAIIPKIIPVLNPVMLLV
ncbi:hypothetical protein [Brevibacillus reuszeri]|nr:hypothetical protein [Brevibacillus reuszeri]